ncbi:hypothetical protein [Rossellomorea sp. SC111]|uniref:hypothetical protein n=1 Tax=Rossellomorea sp. SC111 TaxID=2968985 RepID=UPI00215AA014|nr:hypothetical protein [Rossellomorea sp. SC111]
MNIQTKTPRKNQQKMILTPKVIIDIVLPMPGFLLVPKKQNIKHKNAVIGANRIKLTIDPKPFQS